MFQYQSHCYIGNADDYSSFDAIVVSKYCSKTAFGFFDCYSYYIHNPSDVDTQSIIQLKIEIQNVSSYHNE